MNVISFSVWGEQEKYLQGAMENLALAPKFYPGWACRFYCDAQVPDRYMDMLEFYGAEVVRMPRCDNMEGLYWRFQPMFDKTADRFIVRDTDSGLNEREADAVVEWVESGASFHVMRDHPEHNVAVMGGMWGAKAGSIPEFRILMEVWQAMFKGNPGNPRGQFHGGDQEFLAQDIWPLVKDTCISHDEYFNYNGRERPFRVKLPDGEYVGMREEDRRIG